MTTIATRFFASALQNFSQLFKLVLTRLSRCLWRPESRDTLLDTDAAPGDCLYRICRRVGGCARIVYVHVTARDFIPPDDISFGPFVVRRLSELREWHTAWTTLTVSTDDASKLQVSVDAFEPHSVSSEYVHNGFPLFDIMNFERDNRVKVRTWRCQQRGIEIYVKLARFEFEVEALEREMKIYNRLSEKGSSLSPALVGYVYEVTPDRVVGFITQGLAGHYPSPTDEKACSAALKSLHEMGIAHGDLNQYNIIMTEEGPKFIDFEVAQLREEVTDWEQLAQGELQGLSAKLSDESGLGMPW